MKADIRKELLKCIKERFESYNQKREGTLFLLEPTKIKLNIYSDFEATAIIPKTDGKWTHVLCSLVPQANYWTTIVPADSNYMSRCEAIQKERRFIEEHNLRIDMERENAQTIPQN